jgi:hypothetical protein
MVMDVGNIPQQLKKRLFKKVTEKENKQIGCPTVVKSQTKRLTNDVKIPM